LGCFFFFFLIKILYCRDIRTYCEKTMPDGELALDELGSDFDCEYKH